MTTRADITEAIRTYGTLARHQLPNWLRNPQTPHDFNRAVAVLTATDPRYTDVTPVYDERDELVAWNGIGLKR